jgi:hypothetical protein
MEYIFILWLTKIIKTQKKYKGDKTCCSGSKFNSQKCKAMEIFCV